MSKQQLAQIEAPLLSPESKQYAGSEQAEADYEDDFEKVVVDEEIKQEEPQIGTLSHEGLVNQNTADVGELIGAI